MISIARKMTLLLVVMILMLIEKSELKDLDECLSSCNWKDSSCTDTNKGYICTCNIGFELKGNSCRDINECLDTCNGPNSICENIEGSYFCTCKKGYQLDIDTKRCKAPCSCLLEIKDTCLALNKDAMDSQGKCYSEKLLSDISYLDKTKENLVITKDRLNKCQIQLRQLLPTFIDEYDECAFNIHYLKRLQIKLDELKNDYGYLQKLFGDFTKKSGQKDAIKEDI